MYSALTQRDQGVGHRLRAAILPGHLNQRLSCKPEMLEHSELCIFKTGN